MTTRCCAVDNPPILPYTCVMDNDVQASPAQIARTFALGLAEAIRALPEDGATKSRDYGRGYAQAIRDVLELLEPVPEVDGQMSLFDPDGMGGWTY